MKLLKQGQKRHQSSYLKKLTFFLLIPLVFLKINAIFRGINKGLIMTQKNNKETENLEKVMQQLDKICLQNDSLRILKVKIRSLGNIIEYRAAEDLDECHHIIPKSFGKEYGLAVDCIKADHYLMHKLLVECVKEEYRAKAEKALQGVQRVLDVDFTANADFKTWANIVPKDVCLKALKYLNNNEGNFLIIGDFELFDEDELYLLGKGNIKVTQITGNPYHYKPCDYKKIVGCNEKTIFEIVKEQLEMNHFDHIITNPPFDRKLQTKILNLCKEHCDNVVFLASVTAARVGNFWKTVRNNVDVIDGRESFDNSTVCWIGTFAKNALEAIKSEKERLMLSSPFAKENPIYADYLQANIEHKQYVTNTLAYKIGNVADGKITLEYNPIYFIPPFWLNYTNIPNPESNEESVRYNLKKQGYQHDTGSNPHAIVFNSEKACENFKKFFYCNPVAKNCTESLRVFLHCGSRFEYAFPNIDWSKVKNPETITIEEIIKELNNDI